jgi:hypothetical protein
MYLDPHPHLIVTPLWVSKIQAQPIFLTQKNKRIEFGQFFEFFNFEMPEPNYY